MNCYIHSCGGAVYVYHARLGTTEKIPRDELIPWLHDYSRQQECKFRSYLTEDNASILLDLLEAGFQGKIGCPHFVKDIDNNWLTTAISDELLPHNYLWTRVTGVSNPLYSIAATINGINKGRDPLLTCHPVHKAVMFLRNVSQLVRLVAFIGDARWFRQIARHNRSNLSSYFGLRTSQVNAYIEGKKSPIATRLALLTSAWYDNDADLGYPNNFLMREVKGLNLKAAVIHGGKRLLDFLRVLWDDNSNHTELVFDPKRFFKREDEVEAWNYHIGRRPDWNG